MDKQYINKHEAYMLIKHEAAMHELPASKEAYEGAARIVDQMCPVNIAILKQKTGQWIMHIDNLFPCESTQECTVCHAEQLINGNDDNFCPNCGAKMEGE